MTGPDLLLKRLALIETSVQELRTSARPDLLRIDVRTNRELFDVHGYADVDLGIVDDVVANHLDDLIRFASEIRARLGQADI